MPGNFFPISGDQAINAKKRAVYDLSTTVNGGSLRNLYGFAAPGTAETDAGWLIFEEIVDSQGRMIQVNFAGSTCDWNQIWNNRLTLTYG